MENYFNKLTAIILTVLISTSFIFAQSGYHLQYKMQEGKTYRYKGVSTSKVTQEVMGKEMTINTKVNSIDRITVKNQSENGNMTLIVSYDSIKIHLSNPVKDTTISLKNLIGKRIKMDLTKLGVVKNKMMLDTIKSNSRIVKSFKNQSFNFIQLPDKEVHIGSKWQSTKIDTVNNQMGKIIVNSTFNYTLVGKEKKNGRNCLKISFTVKTKLNGKGNLRGMDLYIEGKGKGNGSADFDPDEGVLVLLNSNSYHQMTITASGNRNMIIPVTQSTKTVKTLISN